jgi:hypothetical protein
MLKKAELPSISTISTEMTTFFNDISALREKLIEAQND